MKDYYQILNISRNATQEEIRQAYIFLAKLYHPDTSKEPNAHEKMKEINEAYDVLSDPVKKRNYDLFGANYTHDIFEEADKTFQNIKQKLKDLGLDKYINDIINILNDNTKESATKKQLLKKVLLGATATGLGLLVSKLMGEWGNSK